VEIGAEMETQTSREAQMVFEFERETTRNARMKVVGVGGAGGNAV